MSNGRLVVGDRPIDSPGDYEVVSSRAGRHVVDTGGGRAELLAARTQDGAVWVWWRGRTRLVRRVERESPPAVPGRSGRGRGAVTPPTPAVVVRVMVEPGVAVRKGQAVAVVSAMKMEATLAAPFDGVVRAVLVSEGDSVRPGDVLVDIEPGKAVGG